MFDDGLRGWSVLAAVAAISSAVGWQMGWQWASFAAGVQLIPLWRWFIPVTFLVNEFGVTQWILGRERRISWLAIARVQIGPRGILLYPDAERQLLNVFRAIYLPCGKRINEAAAAVRHYRSMVRRDENI